MNLGLAAGTSVIGILGGLLWWFVWFFWGIPALSVLPVVLMLGFLMSSLLFYLPISFEFLTNDFNFWSAFCCCWLVLPVVFVTFTRIVSCPPINAFVNVPKFNWACVCHTFFKPLASSILKNVQNKIKREQQQQNNGLNRIVLIRNGKF